MRANVAMGLTKQDGLNKYKSSAAGISVNWLTLINR